MKTSNYTTVVKQRPSWLFGLLCGAMFWALASTVSAATLGLSPDTGVYTSGQTFTVSVVVNTQGQPINAIDGNLSFNPSEITVVNVSRASSIFNLWTTEPTFSNANGTISFGGGLPPPGYTGARGTVMTITFRVASAGTKRVSFTDASVLAADGRGTNVLSSMSSASYTVTAASSTPEPETVIEYVPPANTPAAPIITSSTHSEPANWYQGTTAELTWTLPAGITAVRTLLNQNPTSVPTNVYDIPIDSITLEDLPEGESYFHLQFRNGDGWGRVTHYRLAVDTIAPESFAIRLPDDADMTQPVQTLEIEAEDVTSPVNRFIVRIDGAEPVEYTELSTSSTLELPALAPGYRTLLVEAFDAAGNSVVKSISFTITAFAPPEIIEYPATLHEGVIPVIRGQTKPRADVTIFVQKIGFETSEFMVQANDEGSFMFIPEAAYSRGTYEIRAQAIDEAGAISEISSAVRIAVQPAGYLAVGGFIISILSIIVPLVAMVVLSALILVFGYRRVRAWRKGVKVETFEALAIVAAEFAQLKELLVSETEAVKNSRKTNKLTNAEAHLTETMLAHLDEARTRVVKEVSDVKDVIK